MSNTNILSLIFFLSFAFSCYSSQINEMSEDSLKEFIDDSETCYNIENDINKCTDTGSSLKKKGTVASKCCSIVTKAKDGEENGGWCENLSNNEEVQNYLLYYYSIDDSINSIEYTCETGGTSKTFTKNQKYKVYEEISSALEANSKDECLGKEADFQVADGCCYVNGNCLCFSDGVTKNEMDFLLMLMERDLDDGETIDQVKAETFYCQDSAGKKSGTYKELFGNGKIIKFNGIFGLLLVAINFIL